MGWLNMSMGYKGDGHEGNEVLHQQTWARAPTQAHIPCHHGQAQNLNLHHDLLIWDDIPKSITCNNYEIYTINFFFLNFWIGNNICLKKFIPKCTRNSKNTTNPPSSCQNNETDVKNLDTMEKRNTLKHSLDTIKLSKLHNKNKKKKNIRKAQTSSWNFVQRLYFLPPLEIFRELMEIVLGLIKPFYFFA